MTYNVSSGMLNSTIVYYYTTVHRLYNLLCCVVSECVISVKVHIKEESFQAVDCTGADKQLLCSIYYYYYYYKRKD